MEAAERGSGWEEARRTRRQTQRDGGDKRTRKGAGEWMKTEEVRRDNQGIMSLSENEMQERRRRGVQTTKRSEWASWKSTHRLTRWLNLVCFPYLPASSFCIRLNLPLCSFFLWYTHAAQSGHAHTFVHTCMSSQRWGDGKVTDSVISCQAQRHTCFLPLTHTHTHTFPTPTHSVCALHTPGTLVSLIALSPICSYSNTLGAHSFLVSVADSVCAEKSHLSNRPLSHFHHETRAPLLMNACVQWRSRVLKVGHRVASSAAPWNINAELYNINA